jgi:hypothetical protein
MPKAELDLKPGDSRDLLNEIRRLIEEARRQTAAAVNVGLTALYWQIGNRILREVLGNERATYGEQIVATLSRQLVGEFGRGFEEKNLRRMMQFAEAFSDEAIVATLWRQLSWSHFRELLPLAKPHQREFYAEMCRIEGWSVRTLHERIESMLYERTALSRQPDELVNPVSTATAKTAEDIGFPECIFIVVSLSQLPSSIRTAQSQSYTLFLISHGSRRRARTWLRVSSFRYVRRVRQPHDSAVQLLSG